MVSVLLQGVYEIDSIKEIAFSKSDGTEGVYYYYSLSKLTGSTIKNRKKIDMLPNGEKDMIQYRSTEPLKTEIIYIISKPDEEKEICRQIENIRIGEIFAVNEKRKVITDLAEINLN